MIAGLEGGCYENKCQVEELLNQITMLAQRQMGIIQPRVTARLETSTAWPAQESLFHRVKREEKKRSDNVK